MAKMIKLYDGIRLTVDDETEEYVGFGWDKVCEAIHIPDDCRDDLFRQLFMFGRLDLSKAYGNHKVIVEFIPTNN